MIRLVIGLSFLVVSGCAQPDLSEPDGDDGYSIAARSWLGAEVNDMLAVWPNPNMRCGRYTPGQPGCAWWRHKRGSERRDATFDYHCEAIVRYNADGIITDVDVKRSRHCHRRFRDDFSRMTRHLLEPGNNEIETV